MKKKFFTPALIFMLIAILPIAMLTHHITKTSPPLSVKMHQTLSLPSGILINSTEPVRGYSFSTTDMESFWESDQQSDSWSLIFFGYTSCPAFCPHMTEKLACVCEALRDCPLQGYFISIDPENDSLLEMKNFLNRYRGSLIGLRSETLNTQAFAQKLSIYIGQYSPEEQHIEHSASWVLLGPGGYLRGIIHADAPLKNQVQDLRSAIKAVHWDRDDLQ